MTGAAPARSASADRYDVLIAGGGLAGSLAALALAKRRPDLRLLLLEADAEFGGNHVWSFFDADVAPADRWLVEPMIAAHWPAHQVVFPKRRRHLGYGYNSLRNELLDAAVRAQLKPDQYRTNTRVAELAPDRVTLADGSSIEAAAVIDARGPTAFQGLELGWQKFVGRILRFHRPHGLTTPIIMDATVDQHDGYRFVYCLPFTADTMLVEDTYYSDGPRLDVSTLRARIHAYVEAAGWGAFDVEKEETGVLPVALGGDVDALWAEAPGVPKIGLAGGFFHPTTGYSLPDAVRNAVLIAAQTDVSGPALHRLLHARAVQTWRERGFYRLLNRMLFKAGEPDRRYQVLEHFYRLSEPRVARFYAAQSSAFDKARILSGKPPVPVRPALVAALKGR